MVSVKNDGKVTRRRVFSVEFLPITIGRGSRRHSKRRGGDRDRPDHGGGNFRLLHRLLAQVARLMEINDLRVATRAVVEAARESLVIGAG
jgi:hypothetical protein